MCEGSRRFPEDSIPARPLHYALHRDAAGQSTLRNFKNHLRSCRKQFRGGDVLLEDCQLSEWGVLGCVDFLLSRIASTSTDFVILSACSSSLAKKNQVEGSLYQKTAVKFVRVFRLAELRQAEVQPRST